MSLFRRGSTEPPAPNTPQGAHPPQGAPGEPRADETERVEETTGEVPGERGIPSINRVRSVQSRVSSVLTVTVLGALAVALMIWYYSGAINRSARAQQLAQDAARRRAQGDSSLPSLGAITLPKSPFPEHDSTLDHLIGPPPPEPVSAPKVTAVNPYAASGPPKKTPEELELERRLAGPVLSATSQDQKGAGSRATEGEYASGGADNAAQLTPTSNESGDSAASGEPNLASLLKPTATPAVRARVLPTQRFMLPKGAFIDCTLETAISSALPGMTTCVTATDTFSADGQIVLLERGSKLVGETRGQVQQGQPRLFVLWTEVRTPTGVVVPLASPGTDELGRSGLSGTIDHHWWARFGSAILITLIDGAVQGFTQSRGNGNNTIVVSPSSSNQVATEVLRDTLRIPPTIEKAQGDRIQILVARDVDFRSVYALHADAGGE
jgi:type IV secretion system protein VirB10